MTTCQGLITRAMRLLAELEDGGTPTTAELANGLECLQGLINTLPALMIGGKWKDVDVTAAYTAGEDERIRLTDPATSLSITLPATVSDCYATGGSRSPRNGARVQIIGTSSGQPYRAVHVYSSYLASWKRIDNLALADDNPLGPEHDDGLAAMLAVRYAAEFSTSPSQFVIDMASRGRAHIDERLRPDTVTEILAY